MTGTNSPFHRWFSRKTRRSSSGSPNLPLGFDVVTNPNPVISVPETPKSLHSPPSSVFTSNSTSTFQTFTPTTPILPAEAKFDYTRYASPVTYTANRPPPPPPVLPFVTGNDTEECPKSRNHSHSTISTGPLSIFDSSANKFAYDLGYLSSQSKIELIEPQISNTSSETSVYDVLEPYFEDMDQSCVSYEGSHCLRSPFPDQGSQFSTLATPEQPEVVANACGVIMVGDIPDLPNSYAASFDSISLNWETETVENFESTIIRDVSFEFFKRSQPGRLIECLNQQSNEKLPLSGTTTTTNNYNTMKPAEAAKTTLPNTNAQYDTTNTASMVTYNDCVARKRSCQQKAPLSRVPVSPLPPTPKHIPNLFFDPFDHSKTARIRCANFGESQSSNVSDEFNFNVPR